MPPPACWLPSRRFCRNFHLRRFGGMLSPCNLWCKGRESDDGGELQGGPFPSGDHSPGRAVVRGVSAEHTPCRSTHGSTGGGGRSLHHEPVGHQRQPATRGSLSSPQASGVDQLAHGRDLHESEGRVAVSVARGG